jgi:predicted nucleic acid-binding protein
VSALLDTSVIIPYLGSVAYDRLVWTRIVREQVHVSTESGMELLAGSLRPDQRRKADAFLDRLDRRGRLVTPTQEEWLRAGRILARYQQRLGRIQPSARCADILTLLAAERLGAELLTENGIHFRLRSRFLGQDRRPTVVVLDRAEHLNTS